jgi:hypothetical protein
MRQIPTEIVEKLRAAVSELNELVGCDGKLADDNVESELREWLDGDAETLPWAYSDRVTPDEWFFITTLYGEMTLDGQRTHIRKYFPTLFVQATRRDIRNFVPNMTEYAGLRSAWMSKRLCRMGSILRECNLTMSDYAQELREIERTATPNNPMPALDQIIRDHSATGWKTLSVFVRDCVGGNCFPIDSRVEKELKRQQLPVDERQLVGLALATGCNPRQVARLFYAAGGQRP